MPDTIRTFAQLQTLLADNSSQAISAQDLRDMLISLANTVDGGGGLGHPSWVSFGVQVGGGVRTLKLTDDENGSAGLQALGPGVQMFIAAADGDATHAGGELHIKSGDGSAGASNGGDIQFVGGLGDSGANITIAGGRANGTSGGSTHGGDVTINGGEGAGANADGGDINISGGAANGSGTVGTVTLNGKTIEFYAEGGGSLILDTLPEIPAIATAQSIVDALLTLGLVSQAA